MNKRVLNPAIERKLAKHEKVPFAEAVEFGDYLLNDDLPYHYKRILDKLPVFILPHHPFNLESLTGRPAVRFLGKDGVTGISVIAMREWLKTNRKFVKGLRIIYVEDDDNPQQHLIFFEAVGLSETVMCGGCTDCSGEGGDGNMRLTFMFMCIAKERNLRIQKRTVSEYVYEKIRRQLPN